ncbi:MAG TPA: DUF2541 family protein [Aliiroseovarius sp.]|nr:DUF2541 family protein [Aliiroseovarius sp.]
MKKFAVLLIALASLVSLAAPASAHSPQVLLGTREVGYLSDHDTIDVNTRRVFRQIRVCVYRHAVEFRDLDIVFGNGGRQDVAVRRVIPKGDCTRWIDLNGPVRWIDKIKFNYATFAVRSPRAMVKVYAR